ncbi:glycoside hydrolase N-terminal domain-containing protein [Lentzea flaviverrucosa]|uniref:Glycosyl hydrolase family 65, N-terminal domain n=1 Tax=Lentzea flaviverrucosa TaxID=200379 RepID=A0A1H9BLF4_9PSEU|nr:glycoside hydrolase N-terminal domain-containing protein [Lentzea flaviverrucosa]RDI31737.1 glycosyl hydrolase family 65 [Lentzea flaviverrucosa]SEP89776.1 Glycosyl hydrolase family 65, N-terminal domain [Lentzea flaviverrucosa]
MTRTPEPRVHDTSPAARRTDGFRVANGECGAVLYGEPALEKVAFEAGRPAYELRISSPGMTAVGGYGRITDSRTGEVTSTWTDGHGTWTRRAFASRADQVIAHELLPAPGRTVNTTLSVDTALDGLLGGARFTTRATVSNGSGYLSLRGVGRSGRGVVGCEGITRVVAFGGSVLASGATLVVTGSARLLLLTKLDRYESSSTGWIFPALRTALAGLESDYATLFARHTAATAG